MPHTQHNPQALARDVAAAMWSRDRATQALDMQIVRVSPGEAVIAMPVVASMLNGHQTCHGGYIFTLADCALAYACNSYNKSTVASACHIDFLAPAKEGETLEAEAVERSASGRTGVYDVTVRIRGGKTCALFRGKSYRVSGEVIERSEPQGQPAQHN